MVKSCSPPPRLRRPPPLTPACSRERFKGVRRRSWGRWVSEIRIPHSRDKIWLGSYSTAEQAARAYDIASLLLRGTSCSAFLNFADSTTLVSADHELAALVAGGDASPRTIQAMAASAAANSTATDPMQETQEGVACSNDGSSHDIMDDDNYPQSSAAHAGVCNAIMPGSCWIQDLLTLIISPKDKTSPPSLNCSLQLSPSIARRSASPSSLSTPIHHSCHGLQSSSKTTNPDNLLHMLLDDSQLYPVEDLLRDGFTAIAPAVTTRKRFDTETVGPNSCEVDSTQLWS